VETHDLQTQVTARRRWWIQPEVALLIALVMALYFTRLTTLPIVGEESRWARGAVQMLASGDWIVPRQQGQVFPERPPMSSWAMALMGTLRGGVDDVAVRLPSVLAVLLTTLVVYAYARNFLSPFGAFASAAAFATMGQVMQLGRMGESEALFTLLLAGALLAWHAGYARGWRPVVAWSVGYGLAALASLVKAPQPPVYFAAATSVFLVLQRDWRWLLSWSHAVGIAVYAAVIAAWQIPFYIATDWQSVVAIWTGLAADRISLDRLAVHVVTFPLETFACLLPWSPLLPLLARRRLRGMVAGHGTMMSFLVTAVAATYPTLWFASGARGRYFMPLYPCIAVLIGAIIQHCVNASPESDERKDWRNFLSITAWLAATAGLVGVFGPWFTALERSLGLSASLLCLISATALVAALMLWRFGRMPGERPATAAVVTLCCCIGGVYVGLVVHVHAAQWNNLRPAVAAIKQHIPDGEPLYSFTPTDHRFAYFYEQPIAELPWPDSPQDVPSGVQYFCFRRYRHDTERVRMAGRGRTWWKTPGHLPFAWEEIGTVCCDRRIKDTPEWLVVVGRKLPASATRPGREASSDRRRQ